MLATWLHVGALQRKLNLKPILEIELFPTHAELELGMLGVTEKLVKGVVSNLARDRK
jgi:hypothetical protein